MNIQKVEFEVLKTLGVIDNICIKEIIQMYKGDNLNSPVFGYKCDVKFSSTNSNFDLITKFNSIDSWNKFSNKSINNIVVIFDESVVEEFANYVENFKVLTLNSYIYKVKEESVELCLNIYKVFNNINDVRFLNTRSMLVGNSLKQIVIINNSHSFTTKDVFNDKFKFIQDVSKFYNWLDLEFLRALLAGEVEGINSNIDSSRYNPSLVLNSISFNSSKDAYQYIFDNYINDEIQLKKLFTKYINT